MTLELRGLSVSYGGLRALVDVSFAVDAGEIVGLIGPNGAGKTTLLNAVSGVVRPSAGTILLHGRAITRTSAPARAALGIARTFQNVGLVRDATVLANLVMAQHLVLGTGVLRSVLGLARREESAAVARARTVLAGLGVADVAGARVRDLPHGTLKLVELAAALVRRPRLLLLDEPSAGLDPNETSALADRLVELQVEAGFTVLLIDHDMRLVRRLARTIVVLSFGEVVATGPWEQIRTDPRVVAAYLGTHDTEPTRSRAAP